MSDSKLPGPAPEDQGADLREVWKEGKKWRSLFSWQAAVPPFLLGFLPSLWDIHSDYIYADIWDTDFVYGTTYYSQLTENVRKQNKNYTYLVICLPMVMLALTSLPWLLRQTREYLQPGSFKSCASAIGNVIGFVLMLGVFIGVFSSIALLDPITLKYLSYPCVTLLLCGKLLPVFIQGIHTKRLAVMLGAQEATYEAILQLVLVNIGVTGFNHPINLTTYSAVLSSLIAISKAGIEKLLTFGEENVMDVPLLQKLKTITKYIPVFAITSVFRIVGFTEVAARFFTTFTSLAHLFLGAGLSQISGFQLIMNFVTIICALVLPFLVLSLSKCCCLEDLSMSELLEGAVGEFGTITVWGRRGREGSRNIQLLFFLYYLFLYSTVIISTLFLPSSANYSPLPNLLDVRNNQLVMGLCCGALSLPLFLVQIYYMDKFNILTKLRNLGLSLGI